MATDVDDGPAMPRWAVLTLVALAVLALAWAVLCGWAMAVLGGALVLFSPLAGIEDAGGLPSTGDVLAALLRWPVFWLGEAAFGLAALVVVLVQRRGRSAAEGTGSSDRR